MRKELKTWIRDRMFEPVSGRTDNGISKEYFSIPGSELELELVTERSRFTMILCHGRYCEFKSVSNNKALSRSILDRMLVDLATKISKYLSEERERQKTIILVSSNELDDIARAQDSLVEFINEFTVE